jgi:MerR family transcriptional regulator, light-induced transcriptional regulator
LDNNYTISAASRLSGVSELVIRAWEARYNVVEPERTDSNRRLYSEDDINKLSILGKLTKAGHRIGAIGNLSLEELIRMNSLASGVKSASDDGNSYCARVINECIDSIRHFDNRKLEKLFFQSSVELSHPHLMEKIVIPIMERVGDFWRDGIFKVSHEHFASAIIRKFLNNLSDGYNIDENAPKIIVTTPQGQLHEIGALIGASYAGAEGWQVIYLGPSLPAEDIIGVAKETNSKAIYLSMVYPSDDPKLATELRKFSRVSNKMSLFVAGNAAGGYLDILQEINAKIIDDSDQFRKFLVNIRKGKSQDEK